MTSAHPNSVYYVRGSDIDHHLTAGDATEDEMGHNEDDEEDNEDNGSVGGDEPPGSVCSEFVDFAC